MVHGPAESGYLAVSEAMVNIRCTLAAAERAGMIVTETRARLVAIAKALFFPERSYELLLDRARAAELPDRELAALAAWLPTGRVNQKRADALAMLESMRRFLAQDPAPAKAAFVFEHTTLWERALSGARATTVHDAEEIRVLDELRLDGARWLALRQEVLNSLLAPAATDTATASALLAGRVANHRGSPHDIERLLEEAARMEAVRRMREETPLAIVECQMLARIRDTGEFARLRARAEDKLARIDSRRDLPNAEEFSELKLLELRDWYFSRLLGGDMPDDIEQWVRASGYADLAHFHNTLFTEFVYRQMAGAEETARAGARGRGA